MNPSQANQTYHNVHLGSYENELTEDIPCLEGLRSHTYVHLAGWRKTLASTTLVIGIFLLLCFAQSTFGQIGIFNIPALAPGARYVIPLSDYGYNKSHYSVLVKVRLPGDMIYYTVPGTLPTGNAISFLHKAARKRQGDTLYVIHREGKSAIRLEEIWVMVFHKNDHLMYDRLIFGKPDRDFTRAVITNYYDDRTPRGTQVRVRKQPISEFPALPLPSRRWVNPSNQYSF